ncbi:MAG: hypothetical protein ACRCXT_06865 [Paraclostridium sp.]
MLDNALKQAKKALETMYTGKCTIYEYQEVKDPVTKRTTSREVMLTENYPCRLSYKSITKTNDGNIPTLTQVIKLFISNEIEVKAGSKIVVTQNNKTTEYKNTGEPAIYTNHQEVILEIQEDKA